VRRAAAVLAVVLAVAGCGGDDDGDTDEAAPTSTAEIVRTDVVNIAVT
jgi:hypothetical protein